MAKITTGPDGSATITLSDGQQVRVPGLNVAPNGNAHDIRNVAKALFALVERLDKRLAVLEKAAK